jgi:hypothetical protein
MSRQKAASTIKMIIGALVILGICGSLVNKYLNNRTKEIAEREKAERSRQKIASTLKEMVTHFNAIDDWEKELAKGENLRTSKILTIELERLWVHERPILFCGAIEDISTIDDKSYSVRIGRGLMNINYMFLTNLVLVLRCSKSKIDDFLEKHPRLFSDLGLTKNVAVIARITQLKTEYYSDEEGSRQESRVGIGNCLAIMHMGQIQF